MLTESFGLEVKRGDPDCHHSAGFHQKRGKNPTYVGKNKYIYMCVCVYSYICALQEHIYIYFQHGTNLPSNKRQTSRHAGCARAILAHLWQWSPVCFGGKKCGQFGRKSVLYANGRIGVAGCACWMHQHGLGGTDGLRAPALCLCTPSPAGFRGISSFACICAGEVWGF